MNASSLNSSSKKRIRERDQSPDMFAPDEYIDQDSIPCVFFDDSENCHKKKNVEQVLTESDDIVAQQNLKTIDFKEYPVNVTRLNTIDHRICKFPSISFQTTNKLQVVANTETLDENSERYSSNDSEQLNFCSLSSLNSTINNFGLNNKMKEIIHLESTNSLEYSSYSPSSSFSNTPVIYSLDMSRIYTQSSNEYWGPHYGLSTQVWKVIQDMKGINDLYEWQDKCLNLAIESNRNLIYSLPTSGGKTLVAEILMIRELLCNQKNCLFAMPYVSIVKEKIQTLSTLAGCLDFSVEEYAGNRGSFPPRKRKSKNVIYVATLEKAHGIINSLLELGRISEMGLVVFDEIHILGEGKRGASLETLVCKLLLSPESPRIISMSATIGNITELSSFLKADIFVENFCPVKHVEYIKIGDQLLEVRRKGTRFQKNELNFERSLLFPSTASRKNDPDGLSLLVAEVVPLNGCLIFCSNKKNCESVAKLVSKNICTTLLQWKTAEKSKLAKALKNESGKLCPILKITLPFGIAYHHSGLTLDERQLIEDAFNSLTLCCLCCTSTLAAGVNFPARRVILRSPCIGNARLSPARYQQMIGRAGRAGLDTFGESILLVKQSEMNFVTKDILFAPTNDVNSQLAEDSLRGLQQLMLSLLWLDLGGRNCTTLAETLLQSTLLGKQIGRQSTTALELVDKSLKKLNEKNLLTIKNCGDLDVTKLGRATIKGAIDLDLSTQLYNDLKISHESSAPFTNLYLLYLVTPYETDDFVTPIAATYLEAFNKLSSEDICMAKTIGINETAMVKLMLNQKPKIERQILERFYYTLMLNELLKGKSVWEVSDIYGCTRGEVQNLHSSAESFASCVYNFVEEFEEFLGLSESLLFFSKELSLCQNPELIQLMQLPSVLKGRAHILFNGGYRSLTDVATTDPEKLTTCVEHLSKKAAQQMIAAAKILAYENAAANENEVDILMEMVINSHPQKQLSLNDTCQSETSNVFLLEY